MPNGALASPRAPPPARHEGGWRETTVVDLWTPAAVCDEASDPLAAVRASTRVVFDPAWIGKEAPQATTYGPLPRWLETATDHRAWVRRVRDRMHAEAWTEGPSGPVRAAYGDVRVVWVGVVWG